MITGANVIASDTIKNHIDRPNQVVKGLQVLARQYQTASPNKLTVALEPMTGVNISAVLALISKQFSFFALGKGEISSATEFQNVSDGFVDAAARFQDKARVSHLGSSTPSEDFGENLEHLAGAIQKLYVQA